MSVDRPEAATDKNEGSLRETFRRQLARTNQSTSFNWDNDHVRVRCANPVGMNARYTEPLANHEPASYAYQIANHLHEITTDNKGGDG